jgi:hypothetical protein
MVSNSGEDDGDDGKDGDEDGLASSGDVTESEEWLVVSTVEQSGVDHVGLHLEDTPVGKGQVGEEGSKDGDANAE